MEIGEKGCEIRKILKLKNLFYIAPFDTFYYVTLRKILRASGGGKIIFFSF
jgi:hypothetical protein